MSQIGYVTCLESDSTDKQYTLNTAIIRLFIDTVRLSYILAAIVL